LFVQGLRCLTVIREAKVLGRVVEVVILYSSCCHGVRPYGGYHLYQNLFAIDR